MPIPHPVRTFAKRCYQSCIMRGHYNFHNDPKFTATVEPSRGVVTVGNRKGDVWEVPIMKAWAGL